MDDIQIIQASVIYSECLKIATTLALDRSKIWSLKFAEIFIFDPCIKYGK